MPLDVRRGWIDDKDVNLSLNEQLDLSRVSKTAYYYSPIPETAENLVLMELIDKVFTDRPYYGSRRMTVTLLKMGQPVNRKRIVRLMRQMGLEAIYPKRNLSKSDEKHKKYPYLLRDVAVTYPDQVWSTDITYIPVRGGYLYLTAIIDWCSRFVLSWRLSNTMDVSFCLEALEEALSVGRPEIFNSDQGSQYTSRDFTGMLEGHGIRISMDGRGRAYDNIFVERLWRSIKYEEVYIKRYESGVDAEVGLRAYMNFYNEQRPHQSLKYETPGSAYRSKTRIEIEVE